LLGDFISLLRATVETDPYSGEPIDFVEPEKNTRIFNQLIGFFKALKSLSLNGDEVFQVLEELAKSSINRVRFRIFKTIYESPSSLSFSSLKRKLKISNKRLYGELMTLNQLEFIDYEGEEGERRKYFVPEELKPEQQAVLEFIFPNSRPQLQLQVNPEQHQTQLG
jgi:DNA-binding MarR family transcriptional regulator